MFVYLSDFHGCAYALIDDVLMMTPVYEDLTYDTCTDNWVEVDHMALLGEDRDHQLHIEWVEDMLRRNRDGIFADPMRMEDTPMSEMYGG